MYQIIIITSSNISQNYVNINYKRMAQVEVNLLNKDLLM